MSEKEDDEQIGVNMYDDADKESSPLEESIEEDVAAAQPSRRIEMRSQVSHDLVLNDIFPSWKYFSFQKYRKTGREYNLYDICMLLAQELNELFKMVSIEMIKREK